MTVALLAVGVLVGGMLSLRGLQQKPRTVTDSAHTGSPNRATPVLRLYTNPGMTTPQIPLWAAVRSGQLDDVFALRTELWKTTDHLQGALLAGDGDLWIGHVDGFARTRHRGAPVVLVAVTGWRKFALVTTDQAVKGFADFAHRALPYAPFGCPSVDVLRAVMGEAASTITFEPNEPKQLALKMLQGRESSALLPEPVVTTLLEKVPGMRVAANVEDEYARINGGQARMPIAGIAVNERIAREFPDRVERLLQAMVQAAATLAADPDQAAAVLPEEFAQFVPCDIVRRSLQRDPVLIRPARDVADEIERYLRIVTPELFRDRTVPDPGFLWSRPETNRKPDTPSRTP